MKPGVSHLWRARSISLWDGNCRVVLVGRESQFRNRKYFYVGISDKLDEGLSKEKRPAFLRLMHFAMAFCLVLIKNHHWESGRVGNGEMAQQLRALAAPPDPCSISSTRDSSQFNIRSRESETFTQTYRQSLLISFHPGCQFPPFLLQLYWNDFKLLFFSISRISVAFFR